MNPDLPLEFDEQIVRAALKEAWSSETAVQWSAQNPANGQCNVTAALAFDLFGGKVLRTRLGSVWHYYNFIDGARLDLTDGQFTAPGSRFDPPETYGDTVTDRDSAMQGIPQREYDALYAAFLEKYPLV